MIEGVTLCIVCADVFGGWVGGRVDGWVGLGMVCGFGVWVWFVGVGVPVCVPVCVCVCVRARARACVCASRCARLVCFPLQPDRPPSTGRNLKLQSRHNQDEMQRETAADRYRRFELPGLGSRKPQTAGFQVGPHPATPHFQPHSSPLHRSLRYRNRLASFWAPLLRSRGWRWRQVLGLEPQRPAGRREQ